MAKKARELNGFIADLKQFQNKILPETFVAFQKWLSLELYRRIMQKTPVDKGMLRGSWTISIGAQDTTPANKQTSSSDGSDLSASERGLFQAAVSQMSDLKIGQVIWINNAMPYVLRIEFDGHSSVKAPKGMVQISINELKTWLKTAKKDFVRIHGQGKS
jgi:hypothetical protein